MRKSIPDHTAVRVALWRALHKQLDAKPLVFDDDVGLKLINPEGGWQQRPDMHPEGTKGYRAAIVARARFVEDQVLASGKNGVNQFVIIGAGVDTFALRRSESSAPSMTIYEIDQPATQQWKMRAVSDYCQGFHQELPKNLHYVPVDFEGGDDWLVQLSKAGFQSHRPTILASTGVAMYLTPEANREEFKRMAKFAPESVLVLSFMLPPALVPEPERTPYLMVAERAKASGTPFLSFYEPDALVSLLKDSGFKTVKHIARHHMIDLYFRDRTDQLLPAHGEEIMVAIC
jgi:methyltransferase (TIGR00027 family)